MSDKEFEEFMEDPYEDVGGGGEFTTIAKAKVERAYQGWDYGTPKLFPFSDKQSAHVAREECDDYCNGERSYPQYGMLTTVYGDDVPTHPEGEMNDWKDFVPVFHSKAKYTGRVDVSGEYPYDLIIEGLKNNSSVFNKIQWCELSRPIDNVREPGRDKENSQYAHRIYVVKRVFKSREEAYAAAGVSLDSKGDDFANFGDEKPAGLSDLALRAGWTVESLQAQGSNIFDAILEAVAGKNTPNNETMPEPQARKFVCDNFVIELSDLAFLLSDLAEEKPF
jgi:hypothetical protein